MELPSDPVAADPDAFVRERGPLEHTRRPAADVPPAGTPSAPGGLPSAALTAEVAADRRLVVDLRRAEVEQDDAARPYVVIRRELGLG